MWNLKIVPVNCILSHLQTVIYIIIYCDETYESILNERQIAYDLLRLIISLLPLLVLLPRSKADLVCIVLLFELHRSYASINLYSKILDTLLHHPTLTSIPLLGVWQYHGDEGFLFHFTHFFFVPHFFLFSFFFPSQPQRECT